MSYKFPLTTFILTLMLTLLSGCGGSSAGNSNNQQEETAETQMDQRTEIRLAQYMVEGKKLYQSYCMNCHQANGEGLAQLYPPLAKADYLLEDLPRAACQIVQGASKEMTVNGKKYNQMMPGFPSLTPLEVAEILTYITNSWGNEKGLSGVKDVEKWLNDCDSSGM